MTGDLSRNGTSPVNTCIDMGWCYARALCIVTHLDHDHREGENVRFLAICPFFQDLWGSPPWGVAVPTRGAPSGVQVFSDRSETKVRDACITGVVYKDVRLAGCHYGRETSFRATTYSLEISVDHIAGVEVVEAARDVG